MHLVKYFEGPCQIVDRHNVETEVERAVLIRQGGYEVEVLNGVLRELGVACELPRGGHGTPVRPTDGRLLAQNEPAAHLRIVHPQTCNPPKLQV